MVLKKAHFDYLDRLSRGEGGVVCPRQFTKKFINFDQLKGVLGYEETPKSPDMLYIDKKREIVWFVEFKSNNLKKLKSKELKFEVRRKVLEGLLLFYELFGERFCRFKKVFILVYKDEVVGNEVVNEREEVERIYSYWGEELPLIYGNGKNFEETLGNYRKNRGGEEEEISENFALKEFEKNFFEGADVMKCSDFLDFFEKNTDF